MAVLDTYRTYVYGLIQNVKPLTGYWAQRVAWVQGLLADAIAEGLRYAFYNGLANHPQQANDALDQTGADRNLFKFPNEGRATWGPRVGEAWTSYMFGGIKSQVLHAVDEWGVALYPGTWESNVSQLFETGWASFTLYIPPGLLPWTGSPKYGTGLKYAPNSAVYGMGNVTSQDIATLKRLVRKWKPARSHAGILVLISGHIYGEPGLKYGAPGVTYGPATAFRIPV